MFYASNYYLMTESKSIVRMNAAGVNCEVNWCLNALVRKETSPRLITGFMIRKASPVARENLAKSVVMNVLVLE